MLAAHEQHDLYRKFAMAIVTTAIKEYRMYLRKYKKNPDDKDIHMELDLLEAFFRSSAYRTYSNHVFDGNRLIDEIQKQEGIKQTQ